MPDIFVINESTVVQDDDLETWTKEKAPETATVHILVIAVHLFGEYKLLQRLRAIAAEQKKKEKIIEV